MINLNLLNFGCKREIISSFGVVPKHLLLALTKIKLLGNHLSKCDKLALNQNPNGVCIEIELLTQRRKVLWFLKKAAFSISTKNVLKFFINNFILFLFYISKSYALCFIRVSSIKTKTRFHLDTHQGAIFFRGQFDAIIIIIKIQNRPISTLYYFYNTNQHSSWWRRLSSLSSEDVFKTSCKSVCQTSSRRLAKTFSRRLAKMSSRRLQDIFKTSSKDVFKTFSRWIMKLNYSCSHVFKMSSRLFQNVEKCSKDGYL